MKALVLDTETTGLTSNRVLRIDMQSEIIDFYGCIVDLASGEIESELDLLIKPKLGIPEKITKITTITNEMVADAPPFETVAPAIQALIESAPLAIAHNMAFDKEVIDIEFQRLGVALNWPHAICTVEQTAHLKGYRLSMSDLHKLLFEAQFAGAHRAKVDTAALVRCCVELHKRAVL